MDISKHVIEIKELEKKLKLNGFSLSVSETDIEKIDRKRLQAELDYLNSVGRLKKIAETKEAKMKEMGREIFINTIKDCVSPWDEYKRVHKKLSFLKGNVYKAIDKVNIGYVEAKIRSVNTQNKKVGKRSQAKGPFKIQCLDIQLIDNCKEYVLFGRDISGKSACVRVTGYKSFFYIRNKSQSIGNKYLCEQLKEILSKIIADRMERTYFNKKRFENENVIGESPNIGVGFGISQFHRIDWFKEYKDNKLDVEEVRGKSVLGYEEEQSTFIKVSFSHYFYMKKVLEFLREVEENKEALKNTIEENEEGIKTLEKIQSILEQMGEVFSRRKLDAVKQVLINTIDGGIRTFGNKFGIDKLSKQLIYLSSKIKIYNNKIEPTWKEKIKDMGKKLDMKIEYLDGVNKMLGLCDFELFEADIKPKMRFMADKKIVGCGFVNCQHYHNVQENMRISDCSYELRAHYSYIEADNSSVSNFPMRLLAFDIECMSTNVNEFPTPDKCPVIQISVHSKVLFTSDAKEDKIVFCLKETSDITNGKVRWYDTEHHLLIAFWKYVVSEFEADIISGYNSNGFDLPYLLDRAHNIDNEKFCILSKLHKVPVKYWKQRFQSQQAGTVESTHFYMPGLVTMDVFQIIKATMKLRSYALNNVSIEVLKNQKKEDLAYSDIPRLQNGSPGDRATIASYCMQDTLLVSALIEKRMLLINSIEMARTVGTTLHEVLTKGQSYKILRKIMEYTIRDSYFIPTFKNQNGAKHVPIYETIYAENPKREYFDSEGNLKFQGAFVLDPKKGLHDKPVATLDFASLYPSIMRYWNLCTTTILKSESDAVSRNLSKDEYTVMTSGFVFVHKNKYQGLLPKIETELHAARKKAKKDMANARLNGNLMEASVYDGKQLAIKVIMNSIYGFCGSKTSPIPCLPIAVSITSRGRHDIMQSKEWVEKNFGNTFMENSGKAEVVYGDTDSIMIKFHGAANVAEAMSFAKECEKRINDVNHPETPGLFTAPMFLEYEKVFSPYYLLGKKRYIGNKYEENPNKGKLSYSGIELVRRDNCLLLNKCMKDFVDELVVYSNTNAAINVVKNTVQKLYNKDVEMDNLVISKKVSKLDYSNKQPHVEVTKRLQLKNPLQAPKLGDRCEYLICHTDGNKTFDKARHVTEVESDNIPIDFGYYLDKQIKKPMSRLIEPLIGAKKTNELFLEKNYVVRKRKHEGIVKNGVQDLFMKKQKKNK